MADVITTKKPVALEQLGIVKDYVDSENEGSIKGVDFKNNVMSFYDNAEKSGTPLQTVNLPEEMVIDLTKSTVVPKFAWSEDTYPGSTNPSLDGKPVFVLAVKGDTSVTYSFVTLADIAKSISGESTSTATTEVKEGKVKVNVAISVQEGNALKAADDGLLVELEDTEIAVSTDEGNAIEVRENGLYANVSNVNASIVFATDQEVRDLFGGV
ncbi:MAG: hypothetical protein NC401_18965 [Ruminococcus sp.]|nr:hypothetical protein [Ruminococcus sp.]